MSPTRAGDKCPRWVPLALLIFCQIPSSSHIAQISNIKSEEVAAHTPVLPPLPPGGRHVPRPPSFPGRSLSVWPGARPRSQPPAPTAPRAIPPCPGAGAGARAAAARRSFPPAEVGEGGVVLFNPGFPELSLICSICILLILPPFSFLPFSCSLLFPIPKSGLYSMPTGASPNLVLSPSTPHPQPFS